MTEGRGRKRLRRALPVAALAALLVYIAAGFPARRMIFPGCRVELRPGGADVVEYASEDGVRLRGLLVRRGGGAPRPGLVYFHGNAESAAQNRDVAGLLADAGLDVFVAEYRGYGGCAGSPSEDGLLLDARAAVREASARLAIPATSLVLFGRSLGTGVAAAMAAEGHGRAAVLLSPYTSILDLASRIVPSPLATFAVRDTFDSRARLLAARQPVLVLHGTEDRVIPFALGAALVDALGPRGRLVRLEGCGHNDVFARAAPRIVAETARAAGAGRP